MNIYAKITLGILAGLGLITIALNLFAPVLFDCQVTPIRSTQSSSGDYLATIASRTCKDIKQSGTYLEIGPIDGRTKHTVRVFDNSSTDFDMTWESNRVLEVSVPNGVRSENIPRELSGVRIRVAR